MTLPVPPKGKANIVVQFTPVPHGWTFSGEIRTLEREGPPSLHPDVYPYALLWRHMSQFLLRLDVDIVGAAESLALDGDGDDDES